jgi:hypothetical protein
VLSNTILLQQACDSVLMPNAVFCKELIPDVANILPTLILVKAGGC